MNNELVAWMYKTTYKNETEIDVISDEFKQSGKGGDCSEYSIPLYTHPAELTDEEWLITYQTWALTSNDPLVLKQAILRKAQET